MKAAQINQYGGPEVLKTVTDAPKPTAGPDQVVVEVFAAAVNPFDIKVREGAVRQMAELKFPAILGGDLAGTVAEVGEKITSFAVGDAVYGQAGALSSHGSFAEFAPVSAGSIGKAPAGLDYVQAAALPLTSVSAYQALVETLHLKAGQSILIHGGAGGIGTMAIQLAKHLGAQVATTTDSTTVDYVKSLGADIVIDYNSEKFHELVSDYDAVFDTVGGDVATDSYKVLKPGGMLVSMQAQPDEVLMKEHDVKAFSQFTQVNTERLAAITDLVEDGILAAHVDKTFTLDQAGEALSYLQAGGHRGKVVIKVRD
jgi:NADPH:quinone reductase-like Zn-dependent oxidoreductase